MSVEETDIKVVPAFLISRAVNFALDSVLPSTALILYVLPRRYPEAAHLNRDISEIICVCYCFIFEAIFRRTIGKMITGTVVVDEGGGKPTLSQIALRTVIRMTPFEPFSGLFSSDRVFWHDRWSKTRVVRKNTLPIH